MAGRYTPLIADYLHFLHGNSVAIESLVFTCLALVCSVKLSDRRSSTPLILHVLENARDMEVRIETKYSCRPKI